MAKPLLLIGDSLRGIRIELLKRTCSNFRQLPLILTAGYGAVNGWRKAAQHSAGAVFPLPQFATVDDWFVEAALASAENPLQFVSPATRRLVLRAMLTEIRPELEELQALSTSNQFLMQLGSWMGDLFAANVTRWPDEGGAWTKDLQYILQSYLSWQQRHGQSNLRDEEFAPSLYAQTAANHPAPPRRVIFEGNVTLTANLRDGLSALCSSGESFMAAMVIPGVSQQCTSWAQLQEFTRDSFLEKTIDFWSEQNAELEIVSATSQSSATHWTDLKHIQRDETQMGFASAHSPWHELRQAAQAIRERAADIRDASRSALVINTTEGYLDIAKRTFAAHGLPLCRIPRNSLLTFPLMQKLMLLLRLPASHWKIEALADVFGGDALRFLHEGHELNLNHLEKASSLTRQYTLEQPEQIIHLLQRSARETGVDRELLEKDLEALRQLQHDVHAVSSAKSPGEWSRLVEELWQKVTAHWSDDPSEYAQLARQQIAAARGALQVFRKSMEWWQKYFSSDATVWESQLALLLHEIKCSDQLGVKTGVDIINPRQLAQDVPEIIYWAGMTEENFPLSSKNTVAARHQEMMQRLCGYFPTDVEQSVYLLALALADSKEIYFSWPSFINSTVTQRTVLLEEVIEGNSSIVTANQKYFSRAKWQFELARQARYSRECLGAINDFQLESIGEMHRLRTGNTLNIYDGSLGEEGANLITQILQKRGKTLRHSASSLQNYAECAMKYFFEKVLLLEELEANELQLRGNEKGSLLHRILERFYKGFPHPLHKEYQKSAWTLFCALTREEVERLPLSSALQHLEVRRLIGRGGEVPGGVLGKYLLSEISMRESPEKSSFVLPMMQFGLSSIPLPVELSGAYEGNFNLKMEGVNLTGKFDRLDASEDESTVVAIDYKTGEVPSNKNAPDGINFQMPLYVWALEQLFGKQEKNIGGVFYGFKKYAYQSGIARENVLEKKGANRTLAGEEWTEFMQALTGQVLLIDMLIRNGQFPISIRSAEKAGCKYCKFRNICYRNDERQQERQSIFADEALIYLEGLKDSNGGES